jgi:hypothetical protein
MYVYIYIFICICISFSTQVACGGAHTLVLLEKDVPIGLANPW